MLFSLVCITRLESLFSDEWLLIMFKNSDYISTFNKTWLDYKYGFGDADNNKGYWYGLQKFYLLSKDVKLKLRIEFSNYEDFSNEDFFVMINGFIIGPESSNYTFQALTIPVVYNYFPLDNTMPLNFEMHLKGPFYTYDRFDTLESQVEYVKKVGNGGWWFESNKEWKNSLQSNSLYGHLSAENLITCLTCNYTTRKILHYIAKSTRAHEIFDFNGNLQQVIYSYDYDYSKILFNTTDILSFKYVRMKVRKDFFNDF